MSSARTALVLTLATVTLHLHLVLGCSVLRKDSSNTVSLPCSRARLTKPSVRVPHNIRPDDVSRIELNDNLISTIDEYAFYNFSNLDELYLQSNQIESISRTAFAGTKLTKLDLTRNRLLYIPTDALQDLPNLVELELALNQITFIPHGAFLHNPKLEKIDLDGNALRYVDPFALSPLSGQSLRYSPMIVNFARNNLTYLDPIIEHASAFNSIKFKLSENPWFCNCSLSFMFMQLHRKSFGEVSDDEWPTCSGPDASQDKSWQHMTRMDFACAPKVFEVTGVNGSMLAAEESAEVNASSILTLQVFEGDDVRLMCVGNVDPPQNAVWAKDGDVLSWGARLRHSATHTNVIDFREELTLLSAAMNDSGTYSCNVTNLAGTSEAVVMVVVQERPVENPSIETSDGDDVMSNRLEPGGVASPNNTMHYVLLVSAVVAGVVLLLAVISFAYYCVKNRYLSYNAVVYRVRKQEALASKKNAKAAHANDDRSNYLNFGSVAIGADCSAGLLLARPSDLPHDDSDPARADLDERAAAALATQSPDRAPYSSVNGSFGSADAKRKGAANSPLISRSGPQCTLSHSAHHSEMMTLKRGYHQATLPSPYRTVTVCTPNGTSDQLRCMHDFSTPFDLDPINAPLTCSCATLGRNPALHRCEVYFPSPYHSGTLQHASKLNDVNDARVNTLMHQASVNNAYSLQSNGARAAYPLQTMTMGPNGCTQQGINSSTYCSQIPPVDAYYALGHGSHLAAHDMQKPALYNNNLAGSEMDDKSPSLSNSTNSTATFVNKSHRTDMHNV